MMMANNWSFIRDKDNLFRWERVDDKGSKTVSATGFETDNRCKKDARANGWVWPMPPKTSLNRREDF
jgi:hypothetical protein